MQWVRAHGGLPADAEDIAHDVFLTVRRKWDDFDGRNLPGWIYRITERAVWDYRRRAWFRRIIPRPRDDVFERLMTTEAADARREAQRDLYRVLQRMNDKHRSAFLLFEIEGYTGEEIAALEDVPVGTIWRRLHDARKEFLRLVEGEAR